MRTALVAFAVSVIAGCGACAADGDASPPPPASEPAAEGQILEPLPPYEPARPADEDAYERSDSRGLWRLVDVAPDDRTITVTVATGGCLHFSHMSVDGIGESAVTLTAWNVTWSPVKGDFACTMELRYGHYRVRLPEPLRGRTLEGQCVPGTDTVEARQCPDDVFTRPRPGSG